MQLLQKKNIICGNIIAYIAYHAISKFLCQFYPGYLANFAGSTIIFFIAALIIWWFGQMVALLRWTKLLLLLRYFFIDSHTWWYRLFSSSFSLFAVTVYKRHIHWDIWVFLAQQKIPWFHLVSWCGSFVERDSFSIASVNSPETMQKPCLPQNFHTRKLGEFTLFSQWGKLFSGVPSKFLPDSMDDSYSKKDNKKVK